MQILSANVHRQSCPEKIESLENCRSLVFVERDKKCFQQLIQRRVIPCEQFFCALCFFR